MQKYGFFGYLCKKPVVMKHSLLLFAVVVASVSCCVLHNRKADFANTRWTCVLEEFVADAGTETTTVTLGFDAANGFTLEEKSVMPSHPAMYVNPDGTIDTIPGFTREYTRRGTFEVKGNDLILTTEDGTVHKLHILPDRLVSDDLSYQKLMFEKAEKPD